MNPSRLFSCLVALGIAACGEPQDLPTEVKDLRILAVAANPPELLYDRETGGFDAEGVTFEALVADPRGGAPTVAWSFCPVESDAGCADYDLRRRAAAAPLQPLLDELRAQALSAAAPATPERGVGAVDVAPFAARVAPAALEYHLADSALGMGNGAWMSAELAVTAGGERLAAGKRVVLGARDLAQWNPELEAKFGFAICAAEPSPGCLPLPPRAANRNPQIAGVQIARSARANAPYVDVDPASPLVVRAGEELRVRPVLAPDAEEPYALVDAALQTSRLEIVHKREQAIVSWYATAGELGDERTAAPLTKTLDNVFKAPEAPGRASIWMVVRDGHGGVGWRHLEVLVER